MDPMKDFAHASFPPETVGIMTLALESALSTLPHPVGLARVQSIAETILRSSQEGERDHRVLARMALLAAQPIIALRQPTLRFAARIVGLP
jgi:hypothetical protein